MCDPTTEPGLLSSAAVFPSLAAHAETIKATASSQATLQLLAMSRSCSDSLLVRTAPPRHDDGRGPLRLPPHRAQRHHHGPSTSQLLLTACSFDLALCSPFASLFPRFQLTFCSLLAQDISRQKVTPETMALLTTLFEQQDVANKMAAVQVRSPLTMQLSFAFPFAHSISLCAHFCFTFVTLFLTFCSPFAHLLRLARS